ncbi:MAG: hypothetical protein ACI867_001109, partial [Glaciecola sp.]
SQEASTGCSIAHRARCSGSPWLIWRQTGQPLWPWAENAGHPWPRLRFSWTLPKLAVDVLYLDVDDFKTINDAYGHCVGDELLCVIAERTRQQTRPDGIVARTGADEFAVLLAGVGSVQEVRATADRVAQPLRDPMTLSGVLRARCRSVN